MDSETRRDDERGGDFGLTPRGELRVNFVIAYVVTAGAIWLTVHTAMNYPTAPTSAGLLAGWSEYWYTVGTVLWWLAMIVCSGGVILLSLCVVAMHRSQRFRELTAPCAALARSDSAEGEGV